MNIRIRMKSSKGIEMSEKIMTTIAKSNTLLLEEGGKLLASHP